MTWEALIQVPKGLRALMSALGNGDDPVQEDDKTSTFKFRQPQATSSYLVSLAVGDLHFRSCSSRCGVWAEESVVDKAKYEFGEVEEMVTAGEKICGRTDGVDMMYSSCHPHSRMEVWRIRVLPL